MDAAPELLNASLVALPVTGPKIAGQTISVALNSRRTLPRISNYITTRLAEETEQMPAEVRNAQKTNGNSEESEPDSSRSRDRVIERGSCSSLLPESSTAGRRGFPMPPL